MAVLMELLKSGEAHGYSLMRSTGIKAGTIYPLLGRLENDYGLIAGVWEESHTPAPARRVYRLTAAGIEECRRMISKLNDLQRALAEYDRNAT